MTLLYSTFGVNSRTCTIYSRLSHSFPQTQSREGTQCQRVQLATMCLTKLNLHLPKQLIRTFFGVRYHRWSHASHNHVLVSPYWVLPKKICCYRSSRPVRPSPPRTTNTKTRSLKKTNKALCFIPLLLNPHHIAPIYPIPPRHFSQRSRKQSENLHNRKACLLIWSKLTDNSYFEQ